jgi:hypothetical protein
MPHFQVQLEGTGIRVIGRGEEGEPLTGFFATRLVEADTEEEAKEVATRIVLSEWTHGECAAINNGGSPVLKVAAVKPARWWHSLTVRNSGHTFY